MTQVCQRTLMMRTTDHETAVDWGLIDFGGDGGAALAGGRRLERLGGLLVDRPLAQMDLPPRRRPQAWAEAAAVFDRDADGSGRWAFHQPLPDPWQVRLPLAAEGDAAITLEVRPAPSGQVGIFLEQLPQWQWLHRVTPAGAPAPAA